MSDFNRSNLEDRKLNEFKPIIRQPAPDAHIEEEDEEETFSSFDRFRLIMPIIVLAIVCFVSYAWYTDKFAISRDSSVELPIVKASIDPLREKPEDPGGMKIINRDKRVYDAISGKDDAKDKKPENILPAPEEPISQEEVAKLTSEKTPTTPELINKLPSEDRTEISPEKIAPSAGSNKEPLENITIASRPEPQKQEEVKSVEITQQEAPKAATIAPVAETKATEPPLPAPVKIEVKEAKPEKIVKAVTADDIKEVTPKKKVAAEPKKTTQSRSGYRVQLGSYRSEADAEISWKNVKKKFSSLLDGLGNYVEKADLGAKGIYYRLQISGIKNETEARKICQALTEKKQECFFVGK